MKIKKIKIFKEISCVVLIVLGFLMFFTNNAQALTPGALVYRTSGNNKMYGYNHNQLLGIKNGILQHIYPGHVGIYIGQEDGEHYIVEALASGVVKMPAKYFVNEALGERFIGAKIPIEATILDRLKAIKIAKNLAEKNYGYDFNFKKQKGSNDGDWTCSGLVEKIYESVSISNPNNLLSLEYDVNYYGIDITPDGYDNTSFVNGDGDCFSKDREFSKISRRSNLLLPLPEIVGFNAGREYQGERYFFLPYTQFLQPTLKDEKMDITISSSFKDKDIRGKTPTIGLILRWSLINNPLSSIKAVSDKVAKSFKNSFSGLFKSQAEEIIIAENEYEDNSISKEKNFEEKIVINKKENNQNGEEYSKEEVVSDSNNVKSKIISEELVINTDIIKEENVSEESKIKNNEKISKLDKLVEISVKEDINDNNIVSEIYKENENADKINSKIEISTQTIVDKLMPQIKVESREGTENNEQVAILEVSKILKGDKPDEAREPSISPEENSVEPSPSALINKIYSTGMNDFVELYNPSDYDFDLAESGFRLEKTKTADNPSIAIRIGNDNDGIYPGGTVIKAKGYYLIVRDDASDYFLTLADAIATRREFGFTGNGYTIYLGKGAISSSDDEDIIDAVGYGASTYFRGSAPAPEIADNYYLNRISDKGDNSLDFQLSPSSDPSIVWDDYIDDSENDNGNNNQNEVNQDDNQDEDEDNNTDDNLENDNNDNNEESSDNNEDGESSNDNENNSENNDSDFIPYEFPEPIEASGISALYNFSECYGDQYYSVGIFDCGIEIGSRYPALSPELKEDIDLNKFSLSFYYRDSQLMPSASPIIYFKFINNTGQWMQVTLQPNLLQIDGLPNSEWRYYKAPVFSEDNKDWRHFALVINKEENYWAVYFNGQEKYRHNFIETLPDNFSQLEISGDMGSISLDELALWDRALSADEISSHFEIKAPFSPSVNRSQQKEALLKYYWDFNEGFEQINVGGGNQAIDEIGGLALNLPDNSWIWRNEENTGIINKWKKDLQVDFPQALNSKDLSLAFWWRSEFYPKDGRSLVSLVYNNGSKLGLAPSFYRRNFYYNDIYGIFSEGNDVDLPFDENWHHFILTYDSYRYELKLYIDGQIKRSLPFYWIKDGQEPNSLLIANQLNSVELDDIAIFEGTLTAQQAAKLYQGTLIDNFTQ